MIKAEKLHKQVKMAESEIRILKGIDLEIKTGESVAIVGASGSGKSTLLKILAGLMQPDLGDIYINDISLKSIKINHYRSLLGQSITEESPFEGTILDNITLGDDTVPKADVQWALQNTGLLSFVKQQPQGLHTMIYPEGIQMPYSISKKLILARAIVRKPSVLLLNDPLDQLDQWIELAANRKLPIAILIMSRAFTFTNFEAKERKSKDQDGEGKLKQLLPHTFFLIYIQIIKSI